MGFFHLPNENQLRAQSSYSKIFSLTLIWNLGLLGLFVFTLFLVALLLKLYQRKKAKTQFLRESILTLEERSSGRIIKSQESEPQQVKVVEANPASNIFRVANIATSILFYALWIVIGLIYLTLFMFGYFGRGTHIDVLTVFVMTLLLVLPTILWKYKTKVSPLSEIRKELTFTIVMLLLWLGVSTFAVIATKGACVCYFNDAYGVEVEPDLNLSTQFSRTQTLNPPCLSGTVCHLYATMPQDPSKSIFLNAHTDTNLEQLTFTLRLNSTVVSQKNSTNPFYLNNVESIGRRLVHSVLITGLQPDTLYDLEVTDARTGRLHNKTGYKTVPSSEADTVRLVVGGDLGMNSAGITMTKLAGSLAPDAILLGGDTVYDNGMRTCYYSWDQFYWMFDPVYKDLGRLVPLMLSIGNHDVGFDALASVTLDRTNDYFPLFFIYNPQHTGSAGNVPAAVERLSTHHHLIGPTLHVSLDSGYIKNYGEQAQYLKAVSEQYTKVYKFANYHNPIYPSCTDSTPNSNDRQVITQGLRHWTPIFDQYNYTASMEHHTHYRKMTNFIKNDSVSTTGTRYIGDGSWGVTQNTCETQKLSPRPELMHNQARQKPTHIWKVVLSRKDSTSQYSINYTAIGINGMQLFSQIDPLPRIS